MTLADRPEKDLKSYVLFISVSKVICLNISSHYLNR